VLTTITLFVIFFTVSSAEDLSQPAWQLLVTPLPGLNNLFSVSGMRMGTAVASQN